MRFLSVCSGIEAASVAWDPLGWKCVGLSEIERFPSAVLAHHWPKVRNYGDLTESEAWRVAKFDVLVGGTPCQGFSVAGKRGGMDDPRSQLVWRFLELARKHSPRWLLWENVPGALSSNGGADFGSVLGGMAERGYGFAYRVLDAQYFGVAQRRRRVFVVGYLGDWRPAAAVLFERESLRGNPPPSRETGAATAAYTASSVGVNGADVGDAQQGFVVPLQEVGKRTGVSTDDPRAGIGVGANGDAMYTLQAGAQHGVAHAPDVDPGCLQERDSKGSDSNVKPGHLIPVAFNSKQDGADAGGISPPLRAMNHDKSHANAGGQVAVAFAQNSRDELREMDAAGALSAGARLKQTSHVRVGTAVRRLTPRECERLQGFPDDYSLVPMDGRLRRKVESDYLVYLQRTVAERITLEEAQALAADGPRYKALGNSMAVPVMRWLGERIAEVDQ